MKRIPGKFFIFVLLLLAVFVLFSAVQRIDRGMIGIVENKREKKIVRIVRSGPESRVFVWQGAFPWFFSYYEIPEKRTILCDIKLPIPGLEALKEDYYRIAIPLRVSYRIDRDKYSDTAKLIDNCRDLNDMVKRYIEAALKKESFAYLHPAYQREALAAQMDIIMTRVRKSLGTEFQNLDLVLTDITAAGNISLPERAVYNEGMMHIADLRKMDKIFEKGLLDIRNNNEREKIKNEQFYAKLLEISKIIHGNPELLKYIYIDKMGGNVKVILSSDNTGLPAMLEDTRKPKKGKTGEIDNLK